MIKLAGFTVLTALCLVSPNALATWSIIAVDRATGAIGIAGASCTFDVQGIASIVPGRGAIVTQAASNYFARMRGVDVMEEGASTRNVLAAMRDEQFEPERQQYGVILTENEAPEVYSGSMIQGWSGTKTDNDVAVLGNILVGESVLAEAFRAYNVNRDEPLAHRLMESLIAGADAGGDSRCGDQKARSAFLSVFNPATGAITKVSVYGLAKGGEPAVQLLQEKQRRVMMPE